MVNRLIKNDVLNYLKYFPVVFITGARQVGKSTLAMDLGIENYITFDDINLYQSAKTDPKGFIDNLKLPVVIDEVQKLPDILPAVKHRVDQNRINGLFVLTGSSNFRGFKNLSETLAGRVGIVELYPFNLYEIYNKNKNFIDFLFSEIEPSSLCSEIDVENFIINGGFPEIQKIDDEKGKYLWFSSYISTYIERDARDIGEIRNLDGFIKLYKSVAFRTANILNKADLCKDVGIDKKTLDNYMTILLNTYQIRVVSPFYKNEIKKVIKSPKIYMTDTGILSHLLRIRDKRVLAESEYKGILYENFVFSELLKSSTYSNVKVDIYFYRTTDGKEVDFVIDNGSDIVAIEVKSAKVVKLEDFKNISYFVEEFGTKVKKGVVLYSGDKILPFGKIGDAYLYAVPFACLGY